MRCSSCSAEVPEGGRFCASCGGALGSGDPSSDVPTRLSPASHGTPPGSRAGLLSSATLDDARFLPGATVAERYRIIGLLGKGGMGEVYRADDLKLGQTVALKFLPETLGADPSRVQRFFHEVRFARQVTHPNVCRVYDIGEVEGHHYISMEYVDGEDLSTLLKRIGYLPKDKAVQIARQLCAGLAAAHDRGILHRDLKPANIMLDGRGHVRITDFGLAGLAEEIRGLEVRSGTPAYMAPEQLAGKEVSVRSDLFSLGLVLYEMFTGTPAFDASSMEELQSMRSSSTPSAPSSLVEGFDPAVERVVLRCLESEPSQRPASALGVAAALPGGDPLAAALAAGETPSPEMVAAAGGRGGLGPGVAAACVATAVLVVLAQFLLAPQFPTLQGLLGYVPAPEPPAVLIREATDLLRTLGYDEPPADTASGFSINDTYLRWIQENDPALDRWDRLAAGGPPALYFWYRQSPRPLVANLGDNTRVSHRDPPPVYTGEAHLHLSTDGRLDHLRVVPPQRDEVEAPAPEFDWFLLFDAAGLPMEEFTAVEPQWVPEDFADTRMAWEGTWPGVPDLPVQVTAAAFRGKPVFFDINEPFDRPWRMEQTPPRPGQEFVTILISVIFLALMVGGILLARHNLRLGHGDRKGAFKVALFVLAVAAVQWVLDAHHVANLNQELGLFFRSFPGSVFLAANVWLVYIALEPFIRRRWPDAMVSWSRLLAGRLRDPLIGRDILVGGCAFSGVILIAFAGQMVSYLMGVPSGPPPISLDALLGGRAILSAMTNGLLVPILVAGGLVLILVILRVILRKHWLAVGGVVLLFSLPSMAQAPPGAQVVQLVTNLLVWSAVYFVLSRFGLLSVCACFFFLVVLSQAPDLRLNTWYSGGTISVLLLMGAVLAYAFYTSLAGRSLFAESMVPQE